MPKLNFIPLLLVLLLATGVSLAEAQGDLSVWEIRQEHRSGERLYTLSIHGDSVTWQGGRGASEITDFQITDASISFTRSYERRGDKAVVKYMGKLSDGVMKGVATDEDGDTHEFSATPIPESVLKEHATRKKAIAALEPIDILGVFAHPDDETFATGTITKLSAQGKRILLVYATSGDAGGDLTGQNLKGEALAKYREGEMNAAAKVLGMSEAPLYLRYPDGYVQENWDDVLEDVQAILQQTQPKVVMTFGPDGYYGHVDHLAIGMITERAFDELGIGDQLLHVAIPKSITDRIRSAGGGDRFKGVQDKYITYIVNVKKQAKQRVEAMEAHASQFDEGTIQQMRFLGTMTGYEGFVEVRNLGKSGTLAPMFSAGDED